MSPTSTTHLCPPSLPPHAWEQKRYTWFNFYSKKSGKKQKVAQILTRIYCSSCILSTLPRSPAPPRVLFPFLRPLLQQQ